MSYHHPGKEIDLESVCDDILSLFEQDLPQDKSKTIDEYFQQRRKEEEIAVGTIDESRYGALRQVFEQDILPAYISYREKKDAILKKSKERKVWKYVVGVVIASEIFEAIASRGKSLSPGVLLPTLPLEAAFGYGLYWALSKWDDHQIYKEKKTLLLLIKQKTEKSAVDMQYEEHKYVIADFAGTASRRSVDYNDVLRREALREKPE